MRKLLLICALVVFTVVQAAAIQKISIESSDYENTEVEMADQFRADGKIYVVVAVILVILFGLTFYLFRTERKLKEIEKEVQARKSKEATSDV